MRLRVVILLAVVAASVGWIATRNLPEGVVYFVTPSELLSGNGVAVGERARLGGQVVPGSASREGGKVKFVVTDGVSRMTVLHSGTTPELFRSGIGVVLEGAYQPDRTFLSDNMLIKHSEEYRPPKPGETPGPVRMDA